MTSHQISFSAFAAIKTAPEDLAVSDQAGQRGCFYPQRRSFPVIAFFTGDDKPVSSDLSPGFYNFECDCLDAPIFVPSGGVRGSFFGANAFFDQQAYRYRAGYEFRGECLSIVQSASGRPFCSLPDTNDAAPAVTAPAVSSQAGGTSTRKSNFDLTGAKLVKRGALVSWYGLRFEVSRVYMGNCWPAVGRYEGDRFSGAPAFFACNSVQVVA